MVALFFLAGKGAVFLAQADALQGVYVKYGSHYHDATELLAEYAEDPLKRDLLARCQAAIAARTNCWDLGSFFIKPIQRILKFPLLLRELAQATEPAHHDAAAIALAVTKLGDVAKVRPGGRGCGRGAAAAGVARARCAPYTHRRLSRPSMRASGARRLCTATTS